MKGQKEEKKTCRTCGFCSPSYKGGMRIRSRKRVKYSGSCGHWQEKGQGARWGNGNMGRKKEERFAANYKTYEEIRGQKRMSDRAVAREAMMSHVCISNWKNGKTSLTGAQAEKIACVLGIPVEELEARPKTEKEEPEDPMEWLRWFGREWVRETTRITQRRPHWLWKGEWA